jgi:hypothetical protein
MKRFTILLLIFAFVSCATLPAEDLATQTFSVEEAHLTLPLPSDWIKMPDRALDRFRQAASATAPSVKTNYVAGFAGPRPPANTPLTLLFVQVFPADLTAQEFLSSMQAAHRALAASRPELKVEQEAPRIDGEIGAVVVPGKTPQGTSGRSYTIPTSRGVIALDLYCPTDAADSTFRAVESCLKKLGFTGGVERNKKWLDDFRSASKAK